MHIVTNCVLIDIYYLFGIAVYVVKTVFKTKQKTKNKKQKTKNKKQKEQ